MNLQDMLILIMKRRKIMIKHFILFTMLFCLLTACGTVNNDSEIDDFESKSHLVKKDYDKEDTPYKDWDTSEVTGIYQERIDSDKIEIKTEEGISTFHLTERAREDITYLNVGEEVTFLYYKKDDKLIIDYIDKSDYFHPHHHDRDHHHRHHRDSHHHYRPPVNSN